MDYSDEVEEEDTESQLSYQQDVQVVESEANSNDIHLSYLPYEDVWSYTVQMFAVASILIVIYSSFFRRQNLPELKTLYMIDRACTVLYIIDIILIIVSRHIGDLAIPAKSIQYPSWILILDCVSIIPFTLMVPKQTRTFLGSYYFILEINGVLKIARIFYILDSFHNNVGYYRVFLHLCELTYDLCFVFIISYCICYVIYCRKLDCPYPITWHVKHKLLYITVCTITGTSPSRSFYSDAFILIFACIAYVFFIVIFCTSVTYFTIALISNHEPQYVFLNKVKVINRSLTFFEIPQDVIIRSNQYLEVFWELQHGYSFKFAKYLPLICSYEVGMDIHWFALKHSTIFRNAELPLLRSMSLFFKSQIMLPGDIVFETQNFGNRMVYLVTGIIQVLSIEDGETPILSFSGGTCLAEMSLFFNYKFQTLVRCKTVCRFYILKRKDFIRSVVKYFPNEYNKLRTIAFQRVQVAQEYHKFRLEKESDDEKEINDKITIMWLKSTLHKLMMKDKDSLYKHQCQNIFLRDEFSDENFNNKLFVADYLDTLVITERLELVTDTVFLKTSCPCIFQPDSIILRIWNTFIIILAIASALLIPLFALVHMVSHTPYYIFINTVTAFWWLDLYIQISTAVKTPNELIANVEDILYYRLGTFVFIVDILSAIPFEIFYCLLLRDLSNFNSPRLHMNRILKVWRITKKFLSVESYAERLIFVNYIKFTFIYCYIIYLFGASAYSAYGSIHTSFPTDVYAIFDSLAEQILIVAQVIVGLSVENVVIKKNLFYLFYTFLAIISLYFTIFIYANLGSVHILQNLAQIYLLNTFNDISTALETHRMKERYQNRIIRYVNVQWMDNLATRILYNSPNFDGLPMNIYRKIKEEICRDTIRKIPAFKNLPDELISDLSVICQTHTMPRNEYVCYAQDVTDCFYLVHKGYCQFIDKMSHVRTVVVGPGQPIAMIETLLKIPVLNSVATLTECKLLKVVYTDLRKTLLKYPYYKTLIDNALYEFKISQFTQLMASEKHGSRLIHEKDDEKSFYKFGYNLKIDSVEEYDYYVPFDRLQCFSFVQYFLLRYTIMPSGKFLYIWELIRSVCAILSIAIYSDNMCGTCVDCWWFMFAFLLDTMAWVDIYVRLHVGYYDENNLLVTHPLKTATHYLKHAFVTDLIAVFPFKYLIPQSYRTNRIIVYLQLNRVLQVYRFINFLNFKDFYTFKYTVVYINFVKVFVLLIITNAVLGMLLFNSTCELHPSIPADPDGKYVAGVTCAKGSWLAISLFLKPLTYVRMRLYSILLATILSTHCGISGYILSSKELQIKLPIMLVFGFIVASHIAGKFISAFTVTDTTQIAYQNSLKTAKRFMKTFNVSTDLQNQLISHFELKWIKQKGNDIYDLIKNYNQSLKQDMLYDIYGVFLESVSVFGLESKPFIRKLILNLSHNIALKNTYICVVNDVKNDLHIVYKGNIIIVAPGGSKIATLGPGSMFGNLDNTPYARQTISVLTSGHVEILTINSIDFHKILKEYQDSYKRYKSLTISHVDYFSGRGFSVKESASNSTHVSFSSFQFLSKSVIYPKSKFIKCWTIIHLALVCYLEVAFTLYQIATKEYYKAFVICQYICDLMNILNFLFTFRIAYENEIGILITDARLVRNHFLKNKFDFYMQLIAIIPLDIFTWFLPSSIHLYLHPILRLNRVLRIYLVCKYFHNRQKRLNINLFKIRFLYLVLVTFFVLHCCTFSFYVIGCIDSDVNMNPPIVCDPNVDSFTKFRRFVLYFCSNLLYITFASDPLNYPETTILTLYYIFLLNFLHMMQCMIISYMYVTLYKYYNLQMKYDQYVKKYYAYMQNNNVSTFLVGKIYNFLILMWKNHKGGTTPLLILEAPSRLREQILNSAFAHHINAHYIFEKCHVDFNRQIVYFLRIETYFRNDYIVFKGTINHCMYFIHSGAVAVSTTTNSLEEETKIILRRDSSFGIISGLISKECHSYNCRALTTTIILTLNLEAWEHLLKFYPASAAVIRERMENVSDIYI